MPSPSPLLMPICVFVCVGADCGCFRVGRKTFRQKWEVRRVEAGLAESFSAFPTDCLPMMTWSLPHHSTNPFRSAQTERPPGPLSLCFGESPSACSAAVSAGPERAPRHRGAGIAAEVALAMHQSSDGVASGRMYRRGLMLHGGGSRKGLPD